MSDKIYLSFYFSVASCCAMTVFTLFTISVQRGMSPEQFTVAIFIMMLGMYYGIRTVTYERGDDEKAIN